MIQAARGELENRPAGAASRRRDKSSFMDMLALFYEADCRQDDSPPPSLTASLASNGIRDESKRGGFLSGLRRRRRDPR